VTDASPRLAGRTAELLSTLIRNACVNDDTDASGHERRSADVLASVLPVGSFELHHPPDLPERASLVARLDGTDPAAATLLLLAHTDVVPVNPSGWSHDPFGGELIDGEVWGRGAVDMLNQAAAMALAFTELAQDDRLRGSLVFAAVADEEAGGYHGALHLLDTAPDLLRCDVALTEAGGTVTPTSRGPVLDITVGEKGMAPTRLVARGRPAHASTPRAGHNALVTAADAIGRIAAARPATRIGEDWRRWVDATIDDEELRAELLDEDRLWGALDRLPDDVAVRAHACTHSTYTPTLVGGGLKNNIVPDEVTVELDIRIVPGETVADVERFVRRLLHDLPVDVEVIFRTEPSHSPVSGPVWPALERAIARAHPGGRAAPTLFTGATDGRHLRAHGVPVYGFGVLSAAVDRASYWSRFHGDDERIDLESLALSTAAWIDVARDFLG
jgi:acetylornithine deacetylase/succinyl-diaminopimelate desuccinylase-like protein